MVTSRQREENQDVDAIEYLRRRFWQDHHIPLSGNLEHDKRLTWELARDGEAARVTFDDA